MTRKFVKRSIFWGRGGLRPGCCHCFCCSPALIVPYCPQDPLFAQLIVPWAHCPLGSLLPWSSVSFELLLALVSLLPWASRPLGSLCPWPIVPWAHCPWVYYCHRLLVPSSLLPWAQCPLGFFLLPWSRYCHRLGVPLAHCPLGPLLPWVPCPTVPIVPPPQTDPHPRPGDASVAQHSPSGGPVPYPNPRDSCTDIKPGCITIKNSPAAPRRPWCQPRVQAGLHTGWPGPNGTTNTGSISGAGLATPVRAPGNKYRHGHGPGARSGAGGRRAEGSVPGGGRAGPHHQLIWPR